MKHKQTLRTLIIVVSGILFAAYSAYNVFIIVRDGSSLPAMGIFISALVALMFGVLAAFSLTSVFTAAASESITVHKDSELAGMSEVKNIGFLMMRSIAFNIALLVIFLLKLRMAGQVIAYLDYSTPHTVLYGGAYFVTLAAMLVLLVYYTFIVRKLPLYPRASVILPLSALILFFCGLAKEAVLLFVFNIGLEANLLRTAVIRPVFYLGFIGLSAYFLIPPPLTEENN